MDDNQQTRRHLIARFIITFFVVFILFSSLACIWVVPDSNVLLLWRWFSGKSEANSLNPVHKAESFSALLARCGSALDAQNIDWTIAFGTLLGWYHKGDFIVGDNDIDIIAFVDSGNAEKFAAALAELLATGFTIIDRSAKTGRIMVIDNVSGLQLDIYIFELNPARPNSYRQKSLLGRMLWPGHGGLNVDKLVFFPIGKGTMAGNAAVSIMSDPESFLRGVYGNDAITPDFVL